MARESLSTFRITFRVTTALAMLVQIGGKTVRDTLFWSVFDQSARPELVVAAAVASFPVVTLVAARFSRQGPARVLPALFLVSAILLAAEAITTAAGFNAIAARAVWIHLAALGPVLLSGWWAVALQQFDPRSARREISALAASSTIGALLGGLVCAVLPVTVLLALFAGAHGWCAWAVRHTSDPSDARTELPRQRNRIPSVLTVAIAPFLRRIALLVLATTAAAGLLDHTFQTTMNAEFGLNAPGGSLAKLKEMLSAYGLLATGVTLVLQVTVSRAVLAQGGVVRSVVALPALVSVCSAAVLAAPAALGRLVPIGIARLLESSTRTSLFRPGLELLFGAIASSEHRASKTVIDTNVDRVGDIIGGVLVFAVLWLLPGAPLPALVALALLLSLLAVPAALGLRRGYSAELETTLRHDAATVQATALTGHLATDAPHADALRSARDVIPRSGNGPGDPREAGERLARLRSRDIAVVRQALGAGPVPQGWLREIVPLLGREELKNDAIRALRSTLPASVGALGVVLLDPAQPLVIRRRIPPILSHSPTPDALLVLLRGLQDPSFEVRERCARALARSQRSNPRLVLDRERLFTVLQQEIEVERDVWQARNLLESDDVESAVQELVEQRTDRSLRHVFVLLGLLFPDKHMDIIFEGLRSDSRMRGTALEYLETILPDATRRRLQALLQAHEPAPHRPRPADEIVAELLQEHQSMVIELAARKKTAR